VTTLTHSAGPRARRESSRGRAPAPNRIRRWLAAGVTFAAVYLGVSTGILTGPSAGLLLLVILVAVPSSPYLSRRLALNGSLLLGWSPVLWWVHWPMAVNHGGAVLGVGAAALAFHAVSRPQGSWAARRFLPTCRPADFLIPLSGLAAFIVVSRLALAQSARQVLTILLGGFDNGPHFGMYLMLRTHGATLDALGNAPDGSPWIYASYPQGFHTVVATFTDLFAGHPATGSQELVTYAHGVAVVVSFTMMVLSAALLSLPGLRERPLIALGSVLILCGAFLWQPGLNTLTDGFANFWVGAAAIATALMLSVSSRRSSPVLEATAVGGLIILSAHSWIPLALFGGPAALAVMSRGDGPAQDLRARIRVVVPLALAALGSLWAAHAIIGGGIKVQNVVEAAGPIHAAPPLFPVGLLFVSLYLFGCHRLLTRKFGHQALKSASWRKVRLLALTPVLASLLVGLLLAAQLRTIGTTSYYLVKVIMGCDLVLAAVVAAVGGMLAAQVVPVRARQFTGATQALGAVVITALVVAGAALGAVPRVAPAVAGKDSAGTKMLVPSMAAHILGASRGESTDEALRTEYVAMGVGHARFVEITDVWYHALTCSASRAVAHRTGAVGSLEVTDRESARKALRRVLAHDPRARVLVSDEFVAPLRRGLAPGDRARLRGFQSSPRENADSRSC